MLCRWVCACVRTCVSLSAHCSLFLPCAAGEDKECTGEAGGDLHSPDGEPEGGWGKLVGEVGGAVELGSAYHVWHILRCVYVG